MPPQREEVVAAATRRVRRDLVALTLALLVSCAVGATHADDSDQQWKVEELLMRFSYFTQRGFGYQSQAGPGVRGSETLDVWNPAMMLVARQNEKVQHRLTVPVDIITSASTDAIDVITSASRTNETVTLDINTAYTASDEDMLDFRYGVHLEEWYRSVFGGLAYARGVAQNNATLGVSVSGYVDVFRPYGPDGGLTPPGNERDVRGAFNANAEVTQILSPTTLVKGSYGFTWQAGELLTPWNTVPVGCDPETTACEGRIQERFPDQRRRHALYGLLAQHIPATHSTLRLGYRYYLDDYDVRAHTVTTELYQYVTHRAYLRASYRFHDQNAVYFWTRSLELSEPESDAPRTSDSDLAEFRAHELGGKILVYLDPLQGPVPNRLELAFSRYWRTDGLTVDVFSFGYGRLF